MAMMNIMITRAAEKDLSKIDKAVRLKIIEKLEIYARDQAVSWPQKAGQFLGYS
jgi:mRNA-degrading endonuclease RelE of RelBE toxin-antitoxin system